MAEIISIRDNPQWAARAADYLHEKWGIAREIYDDCIQHSLTTESPLPRWYLMLRGEEILGSYGLIVNDFNSRHDIWPWLAALYIDPAERGHALGAKLLAHGVQEAAKLGFPTLYLFTDQNGYYEKYGWTHTGHAYGVDGEKSKIYSIGTGGSAARTGGSVTAH